MWGRGQIFIYLLLQTRQFDALDECLLGEEECDYDGQGEDRSRSHHLVLDHGVLALEILQTERHSEITRAGQEQQRSGEIVPSPQESENGDGR